MRRNKLRQSSNYSFGAAAMAAVLLVLVSSTLAFGCPKCSCTTNPCACPPSYTPEKCTTPPQDDSYQRELQRQQAEQRQREWQRQQEEARRQVESQVQRDVKAELGQLSDKLGREAPTQAGARNMPIAPSCSSNLGTASIGSAPAGFPPALMQRMQQLQMANTVTPDQKQVMQDRLEELKAEYQSASKFNAPAPGSNARPGAAGTGVSQETIGATAKRVEDWMKSPSVTKFLSESEALMHKQSKLEFFQGETKARDYLNAITNTPNPVGSEFENKQPVRQKPAGTAIFGVGGGKNAPEWTENEQWQKPRVQMPDSYRRKPTVPPVPPGQ